MSAEPVKNPSDVPKPGDSNYPNNPAPVSSQVDKAAAMKANLTDSPSGGKVDTSKHIPGNLKDLRDPRETAAEESKARITEQQKQTEFLNQQADELKGKIVTSEEKREESKSKIQHKSPGDEGYYEYLTSAIKMAREEYNAFEQEISDLTNLLEIKRQQRAAAHVNLQTLTGNFNTSLGELKGR